jgi:hypothetical protein
MSRDISLPPPSSFDETNCRLETPIKFQNDENWHDLIPFHEYFHGDTGAGIGASHQTGWTALVAKLLQQSGDKNQRPAETIWKRFRPSAYEPVDH